MNCGCDEGPDNATLYLIALAISWQSMSPDVRNVQALTDMPPPENNCSMVISNYLSTFSPVSAEVCKPFQALTPVKVDWKWTGCPRICMTEQRRQWRKMHVWNFIIQLGPLPGNWCIGYQPSSLIVTGKGWHELWVWWRTRHCKTVPNCLCQQKASWALSSAVAT